MLLAAAVVVLFALPPPSALAKGFEKSLSPEAKAGFERAQRALLEGDSATSEREILRVLELAPDHARAYDIYVFSLDPEKRKAARERFTKLTSEQADRPALWYALGRLSDDTAAREAAFNRVVELAPDAPWGHFGLALVARLKDEGEKALALYEKAHAMAPAESGITSALVSYLASSVYNNPESDQTAKWRARAKELLDGLVKSDPGSYDLHNAFRSAMGVFSDQERPAYAKTYLEMYPSGDVAGMAHITLLDELQAKSPDQVVARAREVVAKLSGPRQSFARDHIFERFVLGPTVAKGREAVEKLAAEVLASTESSPSIFLSLARGLATEGPDQATAIRLLTRGLDLAKASPPGSEGLADSLRLELGSAYLRGGDPKRAVEMLELITGGDEYASAAIVAAEAYSKLGDPAKAYEAHVRAVAVEPTPKLLERLGAAAKAAGRSPAEAEAAVWAARDARAKPAADFTLTSLDGKPVSFSSLRGKVVLLNFWFPG